MLFWMIAGVMTAGLTLFLVLPLLRHRAAAGPARAGYDLEIYRDQIKELDRDLARGDIDETQAAAARAEIGRRMLAAADEAASLASPIAAASNAASRGSRRLALTLAVAVPLGAVLVYVATGQPDLPGQPLAARASEPRDAAAHMTESLARLERRLQSQPDDVQGWVLLARTYDCMDRPADSVEAYRKAVEVSEGDPDIVSAYAEALIVVNQGIVTEDAVRHFATVLTRDPNEPRARYYLALAREQAGDYQGALDGWTELMRATPADSPFLPTVRERIAEMAEKLGKPVADPR